MPRQLRREESGRRSRRCLGMKCFSCKAAFAPVLVSIVFAFNADHADAQTWIAGNNPSDYSDPSNWNTGVVPSSTDAAVFGSTGSTSIFSFGFVTVGSWTFDASSQNYTVITGQVTFTGTGPNLIFNGGSNNIASGSFTNAAVLITGGSQRLQVTVDSIVISGGTLVGGLSGSPTLTLGSNGGPATYDLQGAQTSVSSLIGDATGTLKNNCSFCNSVLSVTGSNSTVFSGNVDGSVGAVYLQKEGTGTLTLSGVNTNYNLGVYGGFLKLGSNTALSSGSALAVAVFNSNDPEATFDLNGFNASVSSLGSGSNQRGIITNTGQPSSVLTSTVSQAGFLNSQYNDNRITDVAIVSSAITGPAAAGSLGLTKEGPGILRLGNAANDYHGLTSINGGSLVAQIAGAFSPNSAFSLANASGVTLDLGSFNQTLGSLSGGGANGGSVTLGTANLTTGGDGSSSTFGGGISGSGGIVKSGGGNFNLTGSSTYTGATTVNAGTLSVNGSIASSSMTTVNAGGTLGGNGTVGNTTINGGTLSPGNAIGLLTVQGNLVLTSASSYMVEVSPSTADRINVTGSAALGGATVNASFAPGSYVAKQYTILNATGGRTGVFGAQVNSNLPTNFSSSLSYDNNNAYLNLALSFVAPASAGGLSVNQQDVANTVVNYFNTTGGIPLAFGSLTPAGLTQISGETATGTQQATFDAVNQFIGVMTDPYSAGRDAPAAGASAFAADDDTLAYTSGRNRSRTEREAFAMFNKAPRAYEARWNVWAAGFGGSRTTDGNAGLGSNRSTSNIAGAAVGADYWFSPATVAGFSFAGGGTSFSVVNGGAGTSDLFQAGAFVRHSVGSAYVTAAAAYGWQNVYTDRTLTAAGTDVLRANFNANAYSGRIEGGNRWALPAFGGIGFTPYAAAQVTAFDLPSYSETAANGAGNFALTYAGKTVTNTRTELGLRTDKSFAVDDAILTLRGRAAWVHEFNTDRSIAATFQSLPGASFVVNGASSSANAALTTASAEMKWQNGWSAVATFEGEFSDVTRSYAGKGVVRYAW